MGDLIVAVVAACIGAVATIIATCIKKRPSLDERNKEFERQLQEICPHLRPVDLPDGSIGFRPTFMYIPMSQGAVCTECGGKSFKAHLEQHYSELAGKKLDDQDLQRILEAWEKIAKLRKKHKRI